MNIRNLIVLCTAGLVLIFSGFDVWAQSGDVDASLNEAVQIVPKKGLFTIDLETTIYKPDGEGPFPVAIINHGKAPGDSRFQGRYRPAIAARYFLERGYAVIVPMRQGFSKSSGSYIGGGCNVESNGRAQAEDVKAVLDHVVAQNWADKTRMIVLGQSHGGWTTLAFGVLDYPGVKALVNFAGGLRQESCLAWESNLARGAAEYAKQTSVPSLWFYGDNDSFFNTPTYTAMFEKYTSAGGKAKLIAFGTFGSDSHSMFGARAGIPIWQPEVTKLLASVGLPSQPQPDYAQYTIPAVLQSPPKTDFAALEDVTKLPHVKDAGRLDYTNYLTRTIPRAFAVAPNGAWGRASGGDDPLRRALDICNKNGNGMCKLYSVDDFVVWNAE